MGNTAVGNPIIAGIVCPRVDTLEKGAGGASAEEDAICGIMNQLRRRLGPDGFHFLVPFDSEGRFDLFGDDDAQGDGTLLMMEGDHREW